MSDNDAPTAAVSTPFVPARLSYDILICFIVLGVSTALPTFIEVPVFAQMTVSTLLLLYVGSHLSLHSKHHSEEDAEILESKDAKMFPIMGGCMLVSLYLAFKFLPKVIIDVVVAAYFFIIGVLGLSTTFKTFLRMSLPLSLFNSTEARAKEFLIPSMIARQFLNSNSNENKKRIIELAQIPSRMTRSQAKKISEQEISIEQNRLIRISLIDAVCYGVAAIVSIGYLTTKHWILNNIFGMSFTIQGIAMLNLDTFVTGAILLIGLFVYDIFFVFATDVMVTVATKFDAPIKLLFPRALGLQKPSLLGLGDIVVPGIFISLMLRLDHTLYCHTPSFRKPYFFSCMAGYFAGLSTTLFVMYAFEHAQPALLYLVPTCLLSVLLCALIRGEVSMLMNFKDVAVVRHRAVSDHIHSD